MDKSNRFLVRKRAFFAAFRVVSPVSRWFRVVMVLATVLAGLSTADSLLAQGSTPSLVSLGITPSGAEGQITYNEAVSAAVLLRDDNLNPISGAAVTFTVDGANSKSAVTNSSGAAYVNLGQQSIASHTVMASFAGNASFAASSRSLPFSVADAPFQFVGTQGTTLFGDGTVFDVEGVAVDAQDNLYVSDKSQNFVKKEDAFGNITTLPFTGLSQPIGLAFDGDGNLYVADSGNNRILKLDASGNQTVVPVTGLAGPTYLAYDLDDDVLYIADPVNGRIAKYDPSAKTTTTVVSGLTGLRSIAVSEDDSLLYADQVAGFMEIDGFGNQFPLFGPIVEAGGIAGSNNSNRIILSDQGSNTIIEYEYAYGNQIQINNAENPAEGMAIDSRGRVYLALGGRVDVLAPDSGRLPDDPLGAALPVSLIFQVPQAKPAFSIAASPATVFSQPSSGGCPGTGGACVAGLYFTPQIAGVNAGSFTATTSDTITPGLLWGNGIGPAAVFSPGVSYQNASGASVVGGVALDLAGNTYVSDNKNNTVMKVTAQFVTSTLGFTGLNGPTQLAVDGAGAVYVLDSGNQRIERLDTAGNQTDAYVPNGEGLDISPSAFAIDGDGNLVIAGGQGNQYSVYYAYNDFADNLPMVTAVAVDAAGNVYSADVDGNLIRYAPDFSSKTLASGLAKPVSIAVDAFGAVYVAESESGSIDLIHSDGSTGSMPVSNLTNPASLSVNGFGNAVVGDETSLQLLYVDRTRQNYDFGGVKVGTPSTLHGSLSNIGNQPFSIQGANAGLIPSDSNFVELSSSTECSQGATGEPTATVLPPVASCDLSYTFTPPSANEFSNSGTIPTTPITFVGSPGGGTISLSGFGTTSGGAFTITPTQQVFPNTSVGGTSVSMTSTLSNTTLVGIYLGKGSLSDGTDFIQSNNCNGILSPNNGTCTITFTFTPKTTGALSSTYSIDDIDHPDSPLTVTLSGNGTSTGAPQAALTPATANYGSITVGNSSAAQSFTLTNAGTAALSITSIAVGGTNAASFAVSANTCGSSLAAGASCTVMVKFLPTAAGSDTAALSVVDAVGTQYAALAGMGAAVTTAPQAGLAPASADYGSIPVGSSSSSKTFTLANIGTAALPVTSVAITGANASSFAIGMKGCGSTLAAGASCTIGIVFTPSAAGFASASLSVTDGVGTQMSILTGTGTVPTAPAATLTPSTLNFGSVEAGTQSTVQTATLTSSGTAALIITSIQVTGANAAVFMSTNTCGGTLAARASCTISVSFDPTATGSDAAMISVADNATGSPQMVTLTGTATAPPAAADFTIAATPSSQTVDPGSSASYTIALTSTGGTFTQPVALRVSGLPAGAAAVFAPSSATPGSAGASSTLTIQTATQQASLGQDKSGWPLTATVISMALLIFPFRRRKCISSLLLYLGLLLFSVVSLTACGGGFALPQAKPSSTTYTVTVTGISGNLQHSTTVQITVR